MRDPIALLGVHLMCSWLQVVGLNTTTDELKLPSYRHAMAAVNTLFSVIYIYIYVMYATSSIARQLFETHLNRHANASCRPELLEALLAIRDFAFLMCIHLLASLCPFIFIACAKQQPNRKVQEQHLFIKVSSSIVRATVANKLFQLSTMLDSSEHKGTATNRMATHASQSIEGTRVKS